MYYSFDWTGIHLHSMITISGHSDKTTLANRARSSRCFIFFYSRTTQVATRLQSPRRSYKYAHTDARQISGDVPLCNPRNRCTLHCKNKTKITNSPNKINNFTWGHILRRGFHLLFSYPTWFRPRIFNPLGHFAIQLLSFYLSYCHFTTPKLSAWIVIRNFPSYRAHNCVAKLVRLIYGTWNDKTSFFSPKSVCLLFFVYFYYTRLLRFIRFAQSFSRVTALHTWAKCPPESRYDYQ